MVSKILLKRGSEANLPILEVGEPAITTDNGALYIGTSEGNIEVGKAERVHNTYFRGSVRSYLGTSALKFNIPLQYFDSKTPTLTVNFLKILRGAIEEVATESITYEFVDGLLDVEAILPEGEEITIDIRLKYSVDLIYDE